MIGRTVKCGARVKAEQAVIDGTSDDGFLEKRNVQHVLNKEVLRNVLMRFGYSPYYNNCNRQTGWIVSR